jgi:hypothetical protein
VDPSGTSGGTVGEPDGTLRNPRVSPDGRRVAVQRTVQGNFDLWLLDGARTSRVTFDPAQDNFPVWSPDGTRIVFLSTRTGAGDLYQTLTNGAGGVERLVAGDKPMVPSSWSRDGRFLLFSGPGADPQTNSDLWVVPMVGAHTPSVFLKTPFREVWGVLAGWPVGGLRVERIGAERSARRVHVVQRSPVEPPQRHDAPGGAAWRRRTDHAHPALESRGEVARGAVAGHGKVVGKESLER